MNVRVSPDIDSLLLSEAINQGAELGVIKCQTCEAEGLTSTVQAGGSEMQCMGWGPHCDKDGWQHFHDPNQRLTMFHCSNDHHFQRRWYPKCWCGWSADEP